MDKSLLVSNPFALMMNPDDVLHAMQSSDRLGRLQRRVCKPLDRPTLPDAGTDADALEDDGDDTEDVSTED